MNHLLLVKNQYHFRFTIPADCRQYFNRTAITKSLKTSSRPVAALAASTLHRELHALVDALRKSQGKINMSNLGFLIKKINVPTLSGHIISLEDIELDSNNPNDLPAFSQLVANLQATHAVPSAPAVLSASSAVPLSKIIADYSAERMRVDAWSANSQTEYKAIFALLVETIGDIPASSLSASLAVEYKNVLLKLPKSRTAKPAYRDKSIQEMVAMNIPQEDCIAIATLNKNLRTVASLMKYAKKHGYVADNFFEGLSISTGKKDSEHRDALTAEDIRKLFVNAEYGTSHTYKSSVKEPFQYWVPLIAAYAGMRMNEICQLELSDIRMEEGHWVFDVKKDGHTKRVKTQAGVRIVPVHPVLIAKGLLAYVDYLKSQNHTRLFPELKYVSDKYSDRVSKFFGNYFDRCGITDPKKTFHSFRHSVADVFQKQGVDEPLAAAIVGHAGKTGITYGRYGKGFSVETLASVINIVSYGCEEEIPEFNKGVYL